jgi:hypothetical protein
MEFFRSLLDFAPLEDIVFFAAGAIGAAEAADEQNRHAYRDRNSEDVFVGCKPVNEPVHFQGPHNDRLQAPLSI